MRLTRTRSAGAKRAPAGGGSIGARRCSREMIRSAIAGSACSGAASPAASRSIIASTSPGAIVPLRSSRCSALQVQRS